MAEHTAGPWWPFKNTADSWCVATYRDGEEPPVSIPAGYDLGAIMCSCIGDHTEARTRGNEEANARLIAASPTLLEALEELEQRADEVVAALDKYNAENGTHLGGPTFFKIGVALAKARAAITLATGKDA